MTKIDAIPAGISAVTAGSDFLKLDGTNSPTATIQWASGIIGSIGKAEFRGGSIIETPRTPTGGPASDIRMNLGGGGPTIISTSEGGTALFVMNDRGALNASTNEIIMDMGATNLGNARFTVRAGAGGNSLQIQPTATQLQIKASGEVVFTGTADFVFETTNNSDFDFRTVTNGTGTVFFNPNNQNLSLIYNSDGGNRILDINAKDFGNKGAVAFGEPTDRTAFVNISPITFAPLAGSNFAKLKIADESNLILPAGSIDILAGLWIDRNSIQATSDGSVTNNTTVYIKEGASTGLNMYALWVDSGITRLDGKLLAGTDIAGTVTIGSNIISGTSTFPTPFADVPYINVTPTSDPQNRFWVSGQVGSVTVFTNTAPTAAITFNYIAIGSKGQ